MNSEKYLLKQIQSLSNVLIFCIYEYMTGKAKFICNKKYEYLERNVKDDYNKKYIFWKSLNAVFEPISNKNILTYLRNNILSNHPAVIFRLWYHSKDQDELYTGEDLLDLWEKDEIDIVYYMNSRMAFHNHMKMRVIDAIYHYILHNIRIYETQKKIHRTNPLYEDSTILDYNEIFSKMNKIHRLCKSIEILSFDL